ncbi:MAG: acetolactate decarboxylase [Clostridiales bacterium]|nr:acetolactate decarboxylase [Clostridiales bacterium]
MKIKRLLSALLLLAVVVTPLSALCGGTLYQVSTLQALMQGDYYGAVSAGALMERGDTGLGTFDALDGEMVAVNGMVYKAAYDGSITAVGDEELSPFANVAFIGDGAAAESSFEGGYDGLLTALNFLVPDTNMPVVFRVEGSYVNVKVRSVPAQQEPYPPLTGVVKNQAVFEAAQASGVIVGFRFPAYMGDINTTGYHLHFLSNDLTFGGHLLDVESGAIQLRYNVLDEFTMTLPDSVSLYNLAETTDAEIETVEQH